VGRKKKLTRKKKERFIQIGEGGSRKRRGRIHAGRSFCHYIADHKWLWFVRGERGVKVGGSDSEKGNS